MASQHCPPLNQGAPSTSNIPPLGKPIKGFWVAPSHLRHLMREAAARAWPVVSSWVPFPPNRILPPSKCGSHRASPPGGGWWLGRAMPLLPWVL